MTANNVQPITIVRNMTEQDQKLAHTLHTSERFALENVQVAVAEAMDEHKHEHDHDEPHACRKPETGKCCGKCSNPKIKD